MTTVPSLALPLADAAITAAVHDWLTRFAVCVREVDDALDQHRLPPRRRPVRPPRTRDHRPRPPTGRSLARRAFAHVPAARRAAGKLWEPSRESALTLYVRILTSIFGCKPLKQASRSSVGLLQDLRRRPDMSRLQFTELKRRVYGRRALNCPLSASR